MSEFDTYVFIAPGKAYIPVDFRAILFRFASEAAQATVEIGYNRDNGFATNRAAVSGSSKGYFAGGSVSNNQRLIELNFIQESATTLPVLTRRHPRSIGGQSATHGYLFGATNNSDDRQGVLVDKISFATNAVAVAGDLNSPGGSYTNNLWKEGASNYAATYLRSDESCETPYKWSRYAFIGETHTILGDTASESTDESNAPVVSGLAAYTPTHPNNEVERFRFSTETASALAISPLPSSVRSTAAASSSTKGYLAGSNGTTYGLLFISETEEVVHTALQGAYGNSINSAV